MQGHAREIALDIVCADRRRLPCIVNATSDRAGDGRAGVVRIAVIDATERRQYERELLGAKRRAEDSERQASAIAKVLQKTLLPSNLPTIPGIDLAAVYEAASAGVDVGGDFYDAFAVTSRDWVLAIGDVEGKGLEAAVLTSLARHTIRAAAVDAHTPADILRIVNHALLVDDSPRLCTAAVVHLRPVGTGWHCTMSSAGHPPPMLVRPGTDPEELGRHGTVLGYLEEIRVHDTEVELGVDDTIVLYTDGITDARNGRNFFGAAGLADALRRPAGSAAELTQRLRDEALSFADHRASDDIAVVVARIRGLIGPQADPG
jgi:sigma-B regulation protein RsbU (phosphoserine phosphatase)